MKKAGLCTRINHGLAVASAAVVLSGTTASAQSVDVDPQVLQQLQETIKQQQQQLQHQADQIKKQSALLQQLQQQVSSIQNKPAIQPAVASGPLQADPALKTALPAPVTSGNDKIKLSLSGQINRAVNVINDGGRTKLYHVDSDVDNTKISLVGTVHATDDLTIRSRFDVALTADESSQVSQTNQAPGNFIDAKWAEVSITSKKLGKLSLGKGLTPSYDTAVVDLSKTDVIQYSGISDIAGGIFFKVKNGSTLSGTTIADAFNVLSGLGSRSRLRYDSPNLYGFSLSGSLVSAQRSDVALNWGGEGYGFQAAGGFAVANPKLAGASLLYDGSFSLLHTASGLNLTVAGGLQEKKDTRDGTNLYAKLGWLADFTSLGQTAFGIDYTRSRDMAAAGDRGYSVGAAVVQAFAQFSTELYLQYRIFSLNRTEVTPVADINMATFGARVKF